MTYITELIEPIKTSIYTAYKKYGIKNLWIITFYSGVKYC